MLAEEAPIVIEWMRLTVPAHQVIPMRHVRLFRKLTIAACVVEMIGECTSIFC